MIKIIGIIALTLGLCATARAEVDPRGPWVGWAVSRSGHVTTSDQKNTIDEALIESFTRCVFETHSDCRPYHVRPDTTIYALHCNDSRGHEETFVGFTPKEEVFVHWGRWTARKDARDAGFVEGQCGIVYSDEPSDK
ncbi:hypothetical protein HZC00_03150 [Candidatus Kaiserbacteria bacterium]|nr:hypothetical protein [Candidatus Kaiserbacteria bacterium]